LVSLETSRDEITESQDSGSCESITGTESSSTVKPPNGHTSTTNATEQDHELSDDEGLDTQSDSTENYELDGMDTTTEVEPASSAVDMNGDDSLKDDLSDCEEDSSVLRAEVSEINEPEPTIENPPKDEQDTISVNTNELTSNEAEIENELVPAPEVIEKCSDEPEQELVNQKTIETISESNNSTKESKTSEVQEGESVTKGSEVSLDGKINHSGEKRKESKRLRFV